MTPLIAGNWKMNGDADAASEIDVLIRAFDGAAPDDVDVLICPPSILLAEFARRFCDEGLLFGGQDCHASPSGAHTGDISAEMIAAAGGSFVIVGHSERRANHGETDAGTKAKAEAARRAGLTPIVCVGESEAARLDGTAESFVSSQLAGSLPVFREDLVVAYEPVWAVGTGRTPKPEEIAAMHALIRRRVGPGVRILYGGSVKPENARSILSLDNVNGALVGGASLKAADFGPIIGAAR